MLTHKYEPALSPGPCPWCHGRWSLSAECKMLKLPATVGSHSIRTPLKMEGGLKQGQHPHPFGSFSSLCRLPLCLILPIACLELDDLNESCVHDEKLLGCTAVSKPVQSHCNKTILRQRSL